MSNKFKFTAVLFLLLALLFRTFQQRRPQLLTNLVGILLPILSPILHLKTFCSSPSLEINFFLPKLAPLLTPATPFTFANLPPTPDYSDDLAWYALWPRVDTSDLISAGWYQEKTTTTTTTTSSSDDPIQTQDQARCDVFYLHPTTYFSSTGWNAPYNESGSGLMVDEAILFQQASAFHLGCRIYAPRFRQMTATGYINRSNGEPALAVAYSDVKRAFESFLFRRQTECKRAIVLASHSQGTTLMERLLLEYFANDTPQGVDLRSKLVAAYLIGMEIHDGPYSYSTKPLTEHRQDLANAQRIRNVLLPLCEHKTQLGCVVAYRSFLREKDHCQELLGRPLIPEYASRTNQRVVCTNPLSWTTMEKIGGREEAVDAGEKEDPDPHLGCMPIVHPWANVYYLLFGSGASQSSYDRLKGTISDVDTQCTITSATCNAEGMLRIEMSWMQQLWAHGYIVPFPAWTVFSFPGLNTHAYDYNLFFNNIRKNSVERVRAWEKLHPAPVWKEVEEVVEAEKKRETSFVEVDDWVEEEG